MLCDENDKGIKMTTASQKDSANTIHARHQKAGGIYLTVADETAEFMTALEYAGRMAKANKCHVGILHVLESQGFQHWGNVEERMRSDQREAAEHIFAEASERLKHYDISNISFYLEEGERIETLARVIEENPNITMLVLGGGTNSSGPGPLVSYFTGKGMARLRVPVMIVPDHLVQDA